METTIKLFIKTQQANMIEAIIYDQTQKKSDEIQLLAVVHILHD